MNVKFNFTTILNSELRLLFTYDFMNNKLI